jgi:hypothetical protein
MLKHSKRMRASLLFAMCCFAALNRIDGEIPDETQKVANDMLKDLRAFDLSSVAKYTFDKYFRLPGHMSGSQGPRDYDHNVHQIFHNVHKKRRVFFNIRDAWIGSENAANFVGMTHPGVLQVPVRMNVVFVGFSNEKGQGISKDTFEDWFNHLNNVVRHTVVEDPSNYTAPGSHGSEAPVEYVYKFHTFDLSSQVARAIGKVVEKKAILDEEASTHVLQLGHLEELLESLQSVMASKSSMAHAYTMFVLNLPVSLGNGEAKYGYRDGFSKRQLEVVASDPTLRKLILATESKADNAMDLEDFMDDSVNPANQLPRREHFGDRGRKRGGEGAGQTPSVDVQVATQKWAETVLESLRKEEKSTAGIPKTAVAAARDILLNQGMARRRTLLDAIEWERARATSSANHAKADISNCVVDAGVSSKRFGWIDLSAGPFAWGPTVGGKGVRTKDTFPRVPHLPPLFDASQGNPAGKRSRKLLGAPESSEDMDFLDKLDAQQLIDQLEDMESSLKVMKELLDGACEKDEDGREFNERDCFMYARKMKECVKQRDVFANALHMLSGKTAAETGKDLSFKEMHMAYLQAEGARKRFELENPIGNAGSAETDKFQVGPVDPMEERAARIGLMLSKLAGTASAFMHHVVTPASNRQPPNPSSVGEKKNATNGALAEESSFVHPPPLAAEKVYRQERVTFHIHVVKEHSAFPPVSEHRANSATSFDLFEFKRQVLMLKAPDQEFSFTVQQLSLDDDATLATAFQTSMTTVNVPHLDVAGRYTSKRRKSIDSTLLYNRIRAIEKTDEYLHEKNMNGYKGSGDQHHRPHDHKDRDEPPPSPAREISVFLFSVDSALPLFIDTHFFARALPEMVFVAQSSKQLWQSPLACNSKPLYHNLRNPLREALRATLTGLAGSLPSHVTNHVHGKPTHDWQWSIGSSPMACLSANSRVGVSLMDIDAVHRSEIVTVLLATLQLVRESVHVLYSKHTTAGNFIILRRRGRVLGWTLQRMKFLQVKIGRMIALTLKWVEELKYDEALQHLNQIIHNAREMRMLSLRINQLFDPHKCRPEDVEGAMGWMVRWFQNVVMFFAVAGAVCSLCLMLSRKQGGAKPKVN